jgi:hypothetical protein
LLSAELVDISIQRSDVFVLVVYSSSFSFIVVVAPWAIAVATVLLLFPLL